MIQRHLQLAKDKKNDLEEVKALVNLGIVYNNKEEYDKTVLVLEEIKKIHFTSEKEEALHYIEYLEGYLMSSYHDMDGASKHFHALEKALGATKNYTLLAKTYYFLYGISSHYNDVPSTLRYARKVLETAEKDKNYNLISNAYSALAVGHNIMAETENHKLAIDSVFYYSKKAVEIAEKKREQVGVLTFAIAKLNLASYYLNYQPTNVKSINQIVNKILAIDKISENNPQIVANCYGILSQMAQFEKDFSLYEKYLLKGYDILKAQKNISYYSIAQFSSDLAQLYQKIGEFDQAFDFQKLTTDYNSELYNQEQASVAKKIEAQYQFEKKEKEVALLKESSESNRKQKIMYAGLVLITLIGSFFMFRSYHYRLKYSFQKEKKFAIEKQEAILQIKLEQEAQQRLKTEQELLEVRQQKLQDEVLVSQLQIHHKNQLLHQLKEKLDDDQTVNIQKILREENLFDSDFEKVKFEIQAVHPNFFKNINERSVHKLSALDAKYCAYLYLGMSIKQIASLLNVEPKSVRMTKYRLKQKFVLDAHTDLVQFLKNIV